jgi:hypothetical protein
MNTTMNQHFTNDELVVRLWDKEKIRDLMARHSYYYANEWRRKELNDLWVRRYDNRKTASLGNNLGYYEGWDNICQFYVGTREAQRYARLKEYSDALEEVPYSNLALGLGQMSTHTANTHLVELSDDGLTAQYLAIDSGQVTYGHPDGTADEYFTSGTILADLIKEGDEWKIWHLKLQHDSTCSAKFSGRKSSVRPPRPPEDADKGEQAPPPSMPKAKYLGPDPVVEEFGTPTTPMEAYLPKFGWTFLPEQMPVPYEYFDSRKGFGPDGQQPYVVY